MATRYTEKTLGEYVEKVNGWLAEDGFETRLEHSPRNGYQAIDEYSVDDKGERIGSGVNRNIECGSPRECGDAAREYYNREYGKQRERKNKAKLEFADAVLKLAREYGV